MQGALKICLKSIHCYKNSEYSTHIDGQHGECGDEDLNDKSHDLATEGDHAPLIPVGDGLVVQDTNHIFVLLEEATGDDEIAEELTHVEGQQNQQNKRLDTFPWKYVKYFN